MSLTAVFLLLLCECGGGSSPSPAVQGPSALSYPSVTPVYIKGTAITANSPTSTGGAVTSYSVSPALPAGLTLSASSGIISGTPTAVAACLATGQGEHTQGLGFGIPKDPRVSD